MPHDQTTESVELVLCGAISFAAANTSHIVCIRVGHSADCCRGKLTTFLPGEVIMPAIIIACGIARDISVGSSLVSDVFPVAAYLNLCQPVRVIWMTLSVYLIWGGDARNIHQHIYSAINSVWLSNTGQ